MARSVNDKFLARGPRTAPEPETAEERARRLGKHAAVTGGVLAGAFGILKLVVLVWGVTGIASELAHGHWLFVLGCLVAGIVLVLVVDGIRGGGSKEAAEETS
jgi:hypothetical protein